jgi:hypothetical protein
MKARIIMVFCICVICIVLVTSYKKKSIDIVISRYNEDLKWILDTQISRYTSYPAYTTTIYIYNKGKSPFTPPPILGCRVHVINLENVGRCDHTYLHHIIAKYDDLANVTIFLPGSADWSYKLSKTIFTVRKAYETLDTAMACQKFPEGVHVAYRNFMLDEWKSSNEQNAAMNMENKLGKSEIRPFGKWYQHEFGNLFIDTICFNGLMAVSKKHIRNRPVDFYKRIIKYVDHHHNPEAGHYVERSWCAMFHPLAVENMYLDQNS